MTRSISPPHDGECSSVAPVSAALTADPGVADDRVRLVRAPTPGARPPAGSNRGLVRGAAGDLLTDPGPADASHAAALSRGHRLRAVLITHRHVDHTGALAHLDDHVPVFSADPLIARRTAPLRGDELLRLQDVELRVLATPGHTDDSVCYLLHGDRGDVLFTGDTLLDGRRAGFVSRHTGSLDRLLASLELLSGFTGVRGLPGHGGVIADVGAQAASALAHRRQRLERLERLIREDPDTDIAALARSRHPNDPEKWANARWMLQVDVEHLHAHGRLDPRFVPPQIDDL